MCVSQSVVREWYIRCNEVVRRNEQSVMALKGDGSSDPENLLKTPIVEARDSPPTPEFFRIFPEVGGSGVPETASDGRIFLSFQGSDVSDHP